MTMLWRQMVVMVAQAKHSLLRIRIGFSVVWEGTAGKVCDQWLQAC